MGKRSFGWLALALFLWAAPAQAVHVTDDRGVVVEVLQPPRRVVTLMPSLTEIVCELGACESLVGVDNFSNWPPSVRKLPHLGGLEDTHIESVVALKPDLVLAPASSRAAARLESLGLKVLALEPKNMADLKRVWRYLGLALHAADAPAKWTRLEEGVDAAVHGIPPAMRGTTVYFEVNSGPYAASESSFIGEMLTRLGVANVVPGQLGPFPKLNPEFVVRANPEVIMISDRNARSLKDRPGWKRIRALREGRLCVFTPEQGDVMVRPGPRMAEAARLMSDCLQGRLKPKGQ